MTTTCDLSVDWNRCAYCSELRDRVQSASDLRLACSQRLDQAWDEYRLERERGVVAFGTVTHRAWQARIDNLDRQLRDAENAAEEAIDEWSASIHEHHRRYEARQQKAEGSESAETARELFGELRYGNVPDFDLPDDFEDGSWVSLHSASVAVRVYMILLERYAPRAAKGYPAWVANRLRDVLDEAAIQRAITDQEGRK